MKPTIPIIMSRGSGKKTLMAGYVGQIAALQDVIVAMRSAAPHGRDYRDADTWRMAIAEHDARIARINAIIAELTEIAEAIR